MGVVVSNLDAIAAARQRHGRQRDHWLMVESILESRHTTGIKIGSGTYNRLVMYDFDGTLFRSWEEAPKWWNGSELDNGPYSFFIRPESLGEPCVPDSPSSAYWISEPLASARRNSSRADTFVVLITGRVKVHKRRVLELLSSQGIRPNASYFNPGMSAARFKVAVLKTLLVGLNTISMVDVWENENAKTYDSALKRVAFAVGRDIQVNIHHVHVPAKELICGPEDFGLSSQNTAMG
jgi:hypothetical protein